MTYIMIALIPVGLATSLFSGSFKLKGEVEGVTGWRWKAAVSGVVVGMYEGFLVRAREPSFFLASTSF